MSTLASIALTSAAVLSTTTPAAAMDPERRALLAIPVTKFAEAVGCAAPVENPQDILMAELGLNESEDIATYIAFPITDVGCEGGTGTTAFFPVVVRVKEYRSWAPYVDLWATSEIKFVGMNSRNLKSVEALAMNRIRIVALEYGEGDANCCPSMLVDRVYRWERGGIWRPEVE